MKKYNPAEGMDIVACSLCGKKMNRKNNYAWISFVEGKDNTNLHLCIACNIDIVEWITERITEKAIETPRGIL
jgi:hypothetical protein